jgi:DNA-binding CsgD family transcriptional regulator
VIPFPSSYVFTESAPCALVFLDDPEVLPASRALALTNLYRLTPAECRLTDLLLQGLQVAGAARRTCITVGAARFMLKTILAKTGTHRQSELMLPLLSLPRFPVAR